MKRLVFQIIVIALTGTTFFWVAKRESEHKKTYSSYGHFHDPPAEQKSIPDVMPPAKDVDIKLEVDTITLNMSVLMTEKKLNYWIY
ncbi:MAG: hypothetical protein JXB19_06480 [Bacteroidales bacterium]|nr:hypothetical protein [Bacteroidales bacterium]